MIDSNIFLPLESLLRRHIDSSSQAQAMVDKLEGKTLAIKFRSGQWQLYVSVEDAAISITATSDRDPDVVVETSALTLVRLTAGTDPRGLAQEMSLSGDIDTGQDFLELFRRAHPDWEEELSRLVGDVAAHQIGNLARDTVRWGTSVGTTLAANVREFLQEESRDVPSTSEVRAFLDEVDVLSEDAARCEARLKKLEDARQ